MKRIVAERMCPKRKIFTGLFLFCLITISIQCKNRVPHGDPDNGGLMLPQNFVAVVVVDSLGGARHIAINDNGDIYVKLRAVYPDGGNVALRDEDNDGKADLIKKFGIYQDSFGYGTAMRIHNGYLYYSSSTDIFRCKLIPGQLLPDTNVELILTDDFMHDKHGFNHTAKPLTFDDKGNMYVPYGAPSDACQEFDRIPESPGQNPCPQLEEHAGIWVFKNNLAGRLTMQSIKPSSTSAFLISPSPLVLEVNAPFDKTTPACPEGAR